MSSKIPYTTAFAGCGVTLMDRVQGNGGANITQAAITSIAYTVTRYDSLDDAQNEENGTAIITGGTLSKTSVVFDTLQTAAPWDITADATGYNVRYDSPVTDRPNTADETAWDRYQLVWTPASGAVFSTAWIVETLKRP